VAPCEVPHRFLGSKQTQKDHHLQRLNIKDNMDLTLTAYNLKTKAKDENPLLLTAGREKDDFTSSSGFFILVSIRMYVRYSLSLARVHATWASRRSSSRCPASSFPGGSAVPSGMGKLSLRNSLGKKPWFHRGTKTMGHWKREVKVG
jgi:hypothetical protein